ncbi:MAG: LysR family transcriptional regulator [Myxococcales bacterium]|nr:LysR family transcriptional regulator [Myxococcales bacterium]
MSGLPPLRQLNVNALVSLDLLLQERSVTRAAAKHGVSQSAMSQTLRRLREMFGDELLVRSGARLELTPLAERLRDPLHTHLDNLERLVSEAPSFDPARATREMSLALTDYTVTLLASELFDRVGREAPGVDLMVRGVGGGPAFEALRQGDLDLYVGVVPPSLSGIEAQHLWTDRFAVLVRRDHPLTRVRRRRVDAYAAARHLLVSFGNKRGRVDEVLAGLGKQRRVAATIGYFLAAPAIVASSDLVLTLPRRMAEQFASDPRLVVLEPPIDAGTFSTGMAWLSKRSNDPATRWLRDVVASVAEACAPDL